MLIGLSGAARSGKGTVEAKLIQMGFKADSFAAPIRAFICELLGITLDELEKIKERPHPLLGGATPRFAMQPLGTQWGREMLHDLIWVKLCMARAARSDSSVVLSDVRMPNEAEAVREAGGVVTLMRCVITMKIFLKDKSTRGSGGVECHRLLSGTDMREKSIA